MIVVADTSPLNYLILIERIDVLPVLFTTVVTSREVLDEMLHPRAPAPVREWAAKPPGWIELRRPRETVRVPRLGIGESSAISVAEDVRHEGLAVRLLIDEREAVREARARGFAVLGTLAVLEEAAERGLIDIRDALEGLRSTSFFADEAIFADILSRFDARRGGA